MVWWLLFSAEVAKDATIAGITFIWGEEFVLALGVAAVGVIHWLLGRNGGPKSEWRVDANNSNIYIRESGGRITISPTSNQERKDIDELLDSWNGHIGGRAGTMKKTQRFRLDLQGYTSDETFVNLQIQRNESRSGSRSRQHGRGSDSNSTTVAQIFIPTKLIGSVSKDDIIAALKSSMDNKKATVLTPK